MKIITTFLLLSFLGKNTGSEEINILNPNIRTHSNRDNIDFVAKHKAYFAWIEFPFTSQLRNDSWEGIETSQVVFSLYISFRLLTYIQKIKLCLTFY